MKRILITGKNGQVGWEIQRALGALGSIFAFDRQELDLEDPDAIRKAVRDIKPDLVMNAAAYTMVDKAEIEEGKARAINATAPEVLAEESKKCGAIFVHYSTDYVFDGSSSKPYLETDPTGPLNIYGKTKLEGEEAVQGVGGRYLTLRTSWVYGTRGKNFLLTMLRLAKEREELKIVSDQLGAPTWSRLIAETTAEILKRIFNQAHQNDIWGTYHLTCAGQTSWFGFAEEIFNIQKASLKKTEGFRIPVLQPIATSEYPMPALRPGYSVLSNEKLANTFQLAVHIGGRG